MAGQKISVEVSEDQAMALFKLVSNAPSGDLVYELLPYFFKLWADFDGESSITLKKVG